MFLFEVDNVAFTIGLGERLRVLVEESGRVELTDKELTALARTKLVHIALIVIAAPAGVAAASETSRGSSAVSEGTKCRGTRR